MESREQKAPPFGRHQLMHDRIWKGTAFSRADCSSHPTERDEGAALAEPGRARLSAVPIAAAFDITRRRSDLRESKFLDYEDHSLRE
jgi:hypothetical protein